MNACRSDEQDLRNENFKQALLLFEELSLASKNSAFDYWLCAASYCRKNIPEVVDELEWQPNWQKFINQRHGKLPQWMQEVARRLEFEWPKVNTDKGDV